METVSRQAIMRALLPLLLAALLTACASAPERRPRPAEPRPPSPRQLEAERFPTSLPIPVDGVDRSDLESTFNAPRSGGRRHQAIDIFAPRNTPVRSTTDGYVSRRRVLSLGGRTISVVGPGGYRHYYAHLESWAGLDDGHYVRAGEILGYVGNSGNASAGPTHLHYAIYDRRDAPIDPLPLLRRGPGAFE